MVDILLGRAREMMERREEEEEEEGRSEWTRQEDMEEKGEIATLEEGEEEMVCVCVWGGCTRVR